LLAVMFVGKQVGLDGATRFHRYGGRNQNNVILPKEWVFRSAHHQKKENAKLLQRTARHKKTTAYSPEPFAKLKNCH
ncbi:MAG: hypothetical protein LBR88_10850, partial [Zoogloeaceae bacterium]|nr:hypothetical protein [Zoogloeaceae bacterium]